MNRYGSIKYLVFDCYPNLLLLHSILNKISGSYFQLLWLYISGIFWIKKSCLQYQFIIHINESMELPDRYTCSCNLWSHRLIIPCCTQLITILCSRSCPHYSCLITTGRVFMLIILGELSPVHTTMTDLWQLMKLQSLYQR